MRRAAPANLVIALAELRSLSANKIVVDAYVCFLEAAGFCATHPYADAFTAGGNDSQTAAVFASTED